MEKIVEFSKCSYCRLKHIAFSFGLKKERWEYPYKVKKGAKNILLLCSHPTFMHLRGWWIGMGVWGWTCNSNEITIFLQKWHAKVYPSYYCCCSTCGYFCATSINKICILDVNYCTFFQMKNKVWHWYFLLISPSSA